MGPGFHRRAFGIGIPLLLVACAVANSTPTTLVAHLPLRVNAAAVDSNGNIFVAGQATSGATSGGASIAKLSADGATTFYTVTLGGSSDGSAVSIATALAIDSAGDAYVAGTTTATNFPVTPGTVQSAGATAFAVKIDPKGKVVYAALIGGAAQTVPRSIALNSKGELIVSGQSTVTAPSTAGTVLFLVKLSADGTQSTSGPSGIGGLVTVDAHDNIYVAGVPPPQATPPASTPGAFQTPPPSYFCGCPFFGFACGGNQFVAGVTGDLSQTRFLTYLTAKYGAQPASLSLDSQGNILVAGTTSAPGYPTTAGAYQPNYTAASGTVLTCGPPINMEYTSPIGYVTLVKPDGSGLVFSTFLGGSKTDSITFAALTPSGIYLAGKAGSTDMPGFDGAVPSPCLSVGFVTRMGLDGATLSSSRTPPGTPVAYDPTSGTILLASNSDLLRYDPSQPTPIACVLDAADLGSAATIAPGELLTVFGRFLYFVNDPFLISLGPVNGSFPVNYQGLAVMANQTAAPLLYVSQSQVNLQAPYELSGSQQVTLNLAYSDINGTRVSDSRALGVAATNPVAFLTQQFTGAQAFPLALNSDGTVNSQTHPAAAGSSFTVFVDGLGVTTPTPVTGLVSTAPPVPLSTPLTGVPSCSAGTCLPAPVFVSATSTTGSISGVTQVVLQAPANSRPSVEFQTMFSLQAGSSGVRDVNLVLWVK